ncbi:hypothetical protein ABZS66_11685 [Dactylosporangium sp. NPDC005572]|uniref:hypothetical protein n=1 Tax=Dactylosporangium sp. NPDC005572 TaxID=3156889 RepID=UPI0033AAF26F
MVVVVSLNRLTTLGEVYVVPNQFLRWLDLDNMLSALAASSPFEAPWGGGSIP